MRFDDEFLQDLRAHNDITDVVSNYVHLKGSGRYSMGLCPFHNEKSPSFAVYSDTQSYYCFGCGNGGDVITFIKNIENLDYVSAVEFLADRVGMTVPVGEYDDSYAKLSRRILAANREAGRFFNSYLYSENGKKGLEYFQKRGLTKNTITKFGLGYAPDAWDLLIRHLKSKGYSESELISADLAKKTRNGNAIDAFRNRVMFPIIDVKGNVIAFGGRVLDDTKPKYLNTSDTPVYKKSNGVFALNFAKNASGDTLILCEGYMDVIAYHQAGFTNAVAGLGTAFTSQQAKLLSKYATNIILSYDNDEAGQKATKRTIQILNDTSLKIKVALLDGGKDPDEIIKKYGNEKMRQILDNAVSARDYEFGNIKNGIDISTPDGKAEYITKSIDVIVSLSSAVQRDIAITKIASETGVSKSAIETETQKALRKRQKLLQKEEFKQASQFNTQSQKRDFKRENDLAGYTAEEAIIGILIREPKLYSQCKGILDINDFASDTDKKLYSVISNRYEQGKPVEISLLSGELESDEISRLSCLVAKRNGLSSSKAEIDDCVKKLLDERRKRLNASTDLKNISDEDFKLLFKQN